ncbi:AAA family ATPase [Corynebacterium freiburgense]|uniref:AAA family ATPase n=1 Tax=Corynebacterium freiburgense TaxID=556548 RepID=UPI00041F80FD|nr:AAA family ATPase [Corynebacterium freiburgense]WJZ01460.1 ATP-dependent zinc metalloprotease FtsH 3 [Corynebacterium freiburgense]
MNEAAITALRNALQVNTDPQLRLTLAELLIADGRYSEAIAEAAEVLAERPGDERATALLTKAASHISGDTEGSEVSPMEPEVFQAADLETAGVGETGAVETPETATESEYDWGSAEEDVRDVEVVAFNAALANAGDFWEPANDVVTFDDVGGLEHVKRRLNESFIQPMENATIAKVFGKKLRGGLLLYGPPGCGKTFIARAVAGQMGAAFKSVVITDVLSAYRGETEHNIHAIFEDVRNSGIPTVIFLDEIDALAVKRSTLSGGASWLRSSVNQLLLEMDSIQAENSQLYVLAASNLPWDIDSAFLRPGRLDRTVLVTPPDAEARRAILTRKVSELPTRSLNIDQLVNHTERFSGADLDHLCTSAAEKAMTDSIRAESVIPITMNHFGAALQEVRPSTGEWVDNARNVVRYANKSGKYDDLEQFIREYDGLPNSGVLRGKPSGGRGGGLSDGKGQAERRGWWR